MGVEVKSHDSIQNLDTRGIKSFQEYLGKKAPCYAVYPGTVAKKIDGIGVVPWQTFLKDIAL